jgi:UDP-N-acetylglucosamine--N-acetylmuramyl-(pentapeptide) pyrophosphoryl-undecaprenol N-acetylglucosamine transferase
VGIPINEEFTPLAPQERMQFKQELGFDPKRPLIVVTGGGLGARRINDAVAKRLDAILDISSVLLISGTAQYDEMRAVTSETDPRFQLHAFVSHGMASMLGAADIVVTRAGATTILELAALARPTILIPNGYLTGGHQLKNAAAYAENGAVEVLDERELEANPQLLLDLLTTLLTNPVRLSQMSKAFHAFAKPQAASDMADIIFEATVK